MDAIKRREIFLKLADEINTLAKGLRKDIAEAPPVAYTDEEISAALSWIISGTVARVAATAIEMEVNQDVFRATFARSIAEVRKIIAGGKPSN